MTLQQIMQNLIVYNAWRTGVLPEMPLEPKEITETIDQAIARLRACELTESESEDS
jgi:hypothetical protein